MIQFALSLFTALAAIPKILGYLEDFAAGVMLWYVNHSKAANMQAIADAAALSARAETDDEFYAASDAWHSALTRKRVQN